MDRRIDLARGLVAGGAGLLLIALFLPWWGDYSAWTSFETLDLVLAGAALAAGALALGRLGGDDRLALGLAGLIALVVVSQLLDAPPAGQGQDRDSGLWIAVLATAVLVAGTVLQRAQIAVTVDVRGRKRVEADDPETEVVRPAPRERPTATPVPEPASEPAPRESLLGFGEPPTEPIARRVTGSPKPDDQATTSFQALDDPASEARSPR